MLAALAVQWWLVLLRAALALLFGALALLWPQPALGVLVVLFGGYALLNGVLALMMAVMSRGERGFTALIVEGAVGAAIGVITLFLYPRITMSTLLSLMSAWAIITGIASIVTAASLRREMSGEWPLPLTGLLSLVLGVGLSMVPESAPVAHARMLGSYALFAGLSLMMLALRMRQLAHEIARA